MTLATSAREAAEGADALAVITEWLEFRSPDFEWLARTLSSKALFDGRNLYEPAAVRAMGLTYYGIGRAVDFPYGRPSVQPGLRDKSAMKSMS